jgi:hypothetical protein
MLSPQSIRKGVTIKFDGNVVTKQEVLEASKSWSLKHETLFKKFLKQGGSSKINGIYVKVYPKQQILNSKGGKDEGSTKVDPFARF